MKRKEFKKYVADSIEWQNAAIYYMVQMSNPTRTGNPTPPPPPPPPPDDD